MMALTADEVLEKVGSFGWFQKRLLILFNLLTALLFGWSVMVTGIITAEPAWKCVKNSSVCTYDGAISVGNTNYDARCNMSRSEWDFVDGMTSVITEFDLVCSKSIYGTLAIASVFVGFFLGAIIIGPFTDKFGRKPTIFISGFVIALFSLVSAFPKVFWLFVVFKILVGLGVGGASVAIFVLITEFVGVQHRSIMGMSLWYCWSLSLVALAGVGYLIRDWRILTIATAVPGFPALLGWFFTPESVRWLMIKGKMGEAVNVFKRMARVNKTIMPQEDLKLPNDDQKLGDARELFATRKMTQKTLMSWYSWFVNALVYYGVFLSAPVIGGSFYLNFFLTSLVELPAIPAGVWIFNRFGRKKGIAACLILASFSSIGSALIESETNSSNKGALAGKIILSMILAKFFITISFDGIYLYTVELFPTSIRNIAVGTSTAAARIGSLCSPFIVFTSRSHPLLPFAIMGVNALIAGVMCMTLPETNKQPTLETVKREPEGDEMVQLPDAELA